MSDDEAMEQFRQRGHVIIDQFCDKLGIAVTEALTDFHNAGIPIGVAGPTLAVALRESAQVLEDAS